MISVSSGPPQSQSCWLITQQVITITNSTLLWWLRSACCRCLFYVQVRFTIAPLSPFSSHLLVLALKVLATPQVGLISPWYPQDPHLDREIHSNTNDLLQVPWLPSGWLVTFLKAPVLSSFILKCYTVVTTFLMMSAVSYCALGTS